MSHDEFPLSRERLRATAFAQIRHVAQTTSTNDDIAALLGESGTAGVTIVADTQTHGNGRRGRTWEASPGAALLFTTALPEAIPSAHLWAVNLWTALVVSKALHTLKIPAELRWPNDLLLGENKLAGILCVSRVIGEQAWVGCGIGVNLTRNDSMANTIEPRPAFCDDVHAVGRDELLAAILSAMNAHLDLLAAPRRIRVEWEQAAHLAGATYRIMRDGEDHPFDAKVLGLTDDGSLHVMRSDGAYENVTLADCRILR
ncbi:MAG: biotin--[acetyl-CoA-carboxylase] ligase [Vulcanimicrobiaceae bacterium]